jgi:hypothetical protein
MKSIRKIYFVGMFTAVTIGIASISYCLRCDGGVTNANCTCYTEL